MTKQIDQQGNYFIVAPGIWAGTPNKYSSLRKVVEEFIAGTSFEKIHGGCDKKPKKLTITRELTLEDLTVNGNTVSGNCSAGDQSVGQPFYLIRTYVRYDERDGGGYYVIKCKDLPKLQAEASKNLKGVTNLQNILTRGLELKLRTDER